MQYSGMMLGPFYLLFLVFFGIVLFVFAFRIFSVGAKKPKQDVAPRKTGKVGETGVCPVCGTLLTNGAQLKSALYPGDGDRLCHIFGCPSCHPYIEEGIKRVCPVCKKTLPSEGYLIARMFDRPGNKHHVHIIGCTGCRLPKKK